MVKKKNCWEFMTCPPEVHKTCEAFISDLGRECWLIKELCNVCPGEGTKYKNCFECPWYKEHHD